MVVRHPGCDRPLTPWSCETVEKHGRHILILNKPEQLRGLVSPHRKDGTQNWRAGISGPSIVACVPPSTQGRLCVLDSQDSCFLSFDQIRALRIHRVREEGADTIAVQYQALKRLDWLGTHYQGGLRESADIMVDLNDDQGFPASHRPIPGPPHRHGRGRRESRCDSRSQSPEAGGSQDLLCVW